VTNVPHVITSRHTAILSEVEQLKLEQKSKDEVNCLLQNQVEFFNTSLYWDIFTIIKVFPMMLSMKLFLFRQHLPTVTILFGH